MSKKSSFRPAPETTPMPTTPGPDHTYAPEYNSSSIDLGLSFAACLETPQSPPAPHVDHVPSLGQRLAQDKQMPYIPTHDSVEQSRKDHQQQADNSIPGPTDNNETGVSFTVGEDSHLFTNGIISNTARETANQLLTPKDQRLDHLLGQVMANGAPGAFQTFVETLKKHGYTMTGWWKS